MKYRVFYIFPLILLMALTNCTHQPPPTNTPTPTIEVNATPIAFVKTFSAGWADQDPEVLMPLYSKDVKALDADAYGSTYGYSTVAFAVNNLLKSGEFYFDVTSFFVTEDGHFAALFGLWYTRHGDEYTAVPSMSMVEIENGLVVWEYDYYGAGMSEKYALPEIPLSASEVSISETEMAAIKDMLSSWVSAYNDRDAQSTASFYAEDASSAVMGKPEWIVQTKNRMIDNLDKIFSDEALTMTMEDTFVSANGQFAAVQGLFQLGDRQPKPFIMLIEIKEGKIVNQYLYIDHKLYYEQFY